MAEMLISKRAIFPKGEQRKFILNAKEKLGLTWNQLAKILNISTSKKMAFSSRSKPLTFTVYQSLKRIGFSPRFTKDGKDVRIESKNDVQKYFQIIGSHNPKHLKKYRN